MVIQPDELRDIVLSSYELLTQLPPPNPPKSEKGKEEDKKKGKYELSSRNKLKTLPEALRELDDENGTSNITHFVKYASYSLPRAELKGKEDRNMLPFLEMLLDKINDFRSKDNKDKQNVDKIRYLIGYINWNIDTVCNIFTVHLNDNDAIKERLYSMLNAELGIVDSKEHIDKIVSEIMKWKQKSDALKHRRE